LIRFRQNWGKI